MSTCKKKRYPNEMTALLAMTKMVRKGKSHGETRAYPCPECKAWHLTKLQKGS